MDEEFYKHRVHREHRGEKDPLTAKVIGCAIEVHRYLGPGLLESTYEQCLAHELRLQGVEFKVQVPTPVYYKGINLECGYRVDLLVEEFLVVELKGVEKIMGIHEAQLLTYMKHTEAPVGLIINFYEKLLKNGIRRFVL
jgi:GxxExxY protein